MGSYEGPSPAWGAGCIEPTCARSPRTALSRSSDPPARFSTGQQTLATHLELVPKEPTQGPGKGTGSASPGEFPYWVEGLPAPIYRHPTPELAEYLQPGCKHSILGKQAELPRAQTLPALLLTEEEALSPSIAASSLGEPVHPQSHAGHGHPYFSMVFSSPAWPSLTWCDLSFLSMDIPSLILPSLPQHGHASLKDGHSFLLVQRLSGTRG